MADENGKDLIDDAADGSEDAAEGVIEKGKELAEDAGDAAMDAAEAVVEKAGDAVEAVKDVAGNAAGAVTGAAGAAADKVGDVFDGDDDTGSVLKWLLPLLLLGLLMVLGFMFCSKPPAATTGNTNEATSNTAGTETAGDDKGQETPAANDNN